MLNRAPRSDFSLRQAVALGLLQGPTELLPVSSSAHTALLPWLAGWSYIELDAELRKAFEVALHSGSALALAIDMRRELAGAMLPLDRRRLALIALSLAPPAIAGYAWREPIERRLGGPRSIAGALLAGAVAMALADGRRTPATRRLEDANARDGLALGLAQAMALIPGVSRGGATLTAARARGFSRRDAQTLSWRAALPVILAASAHGWQRLARRGVPADARRALAVGGGAAFLSTLASVRLLRRAPGGWSLLPCSVYRCMLALVVMRRLRRAGNSDG